MERTFTPHIKTIGQINGVVGIEEISNEPMFFSCSVKHITRAHKSTAPLTNRILDELNILNVLTDDLVIDTRVTMLMPGTYPSIPGWHCDDFPRSFDTGQPDLKSKDKTRHIMCLLSTTEGISGTKFITNQVTLDLDVNNVWHDLHEKIENFSTPNKIRQAKEGELILFNQEATHTAVPATKAGWRLFFRASKTHRRVMNQIRNQVQVYVPHNGGW